MKSLFEKEKSNHAALIEISYPERTQYNIKAEILGKEDFVKVAKLTNEQGGFYNNKAFVLETEEAAQSIIKTLTDAGKSSSMEKQQIPEGKQFFVATKLPLQDHTNLLEQFKEDGAKPKVLVDDINKKRLSGLVFPQSKQDLAEKCFQKANQLGEEAKKRVANIFVHYDKETHENKYALYLKKDFEKKGIAVVEKIDGEQLGEEAKFTKKDTEKSVVLTFSKREDAEQALGKISEAFEKDQQKQAKKDAKKENAAPVL